MWAHENNAATAAATEALVAARSTGQLDVAARAQFVVGFVQMVQGQLEETTRCYADAVTLARAAGQPVLGGQIEQFDGMTFNWRGEYRTAIQRVEPVLTMFREENQLLHFVQTCSAFTITLGGAGEYARALALITEGIALSESIGDKVWRARMWNTRGWILGEFGVHEAADEANRRCVEVAGQLGPQRIASELIGNAEANLADVALALGDLPSAESHLAAVAAILGDRRNEWMTWRYGMHYHLSSAELALARGDLGRARSYIETCQVTAERTRSRRYLIRASRLLGECHVAAGNLVEAERLLAAAVRDAKTLGNPPQIWHAGLAFGRILHDLGRRDEAITTWREALDIVQSGGAGGSREPASVASRGDLQHDAARADRVKPRE